MTLTQQVVSPVHGAPVSRAGFGRPGVLLLARGDHSRTPLMVASTMRRSIAYSVRQAHSQSCAIARSARAAFTVNRRFGCFGSCGVGDSMTSTFAWPQPGIQQGIRKPIHRIVDDAQQAEQRQLPMLSRVDGPSVVHPSLIAGCRSYRDATRLCFVLRRVKGMGLKTVAEHAGVHVPHMSDYLHADDAFGRRDLPAKHIPAFEAVCGNTAISQYIARCAALTVAEELAVTHIAA